MENIQVDPQWSSEEFLLYGGRDNGGVIVHIDFSGLHERTCQGYEAPGTPQRFIYPLSISPLVTMNTGNPLDMTITLAFWVESSPISEESKLHSVSMQKITVHLYQLILVPALVKITNGNLQISFHLII